MLIAFSFHIPQTYHYYDFRAQHFLKFPVGSQRSSSSFSKGAKKERHDICELTRALTQEILLRGREKRSTIARMEHFEEERRRLLEVNYKGKMGEVWTWV